MVQVRREVLSAPACSSDRHGGPARHRRGAGSGGGQTSGIRPPIHGPGGPGCSGCGPSSAVGQSRPPHQRVWRRTSPVQPEPLSPGARCEGSPPKIDPRCCRRPPRNTPRNCSRSPLPPRSGCRSSPSRCGSMSCGRWGSPMWRQLAEVNNPNLKPSPARCSRPSRICGPRSRSGTPTSTSMPMPCPPTPRPAVQFLDHRNRPAGGQHHHQHLGDGGQPPGHLVADQPHPGSPDRRGPRSVRAGQEPVPDRAAGPAAAGGAGHFDLQESDEQVRDRSGIGAGLGW